MRSLAVALAMIAFGASSAGAQETLGLDCAWISSLDVTTMQNSPTGGTSFYLLTFATPRSGIAKKQGLGAQFSFTADDVEIAGETRYKLQHLDVTEGFSVNRYTGKISATRQVGQSGFIHTGQCKIAQRRQF